MELIIPRMMTIEAAADATGLAKYRLRSLALNDKIVHIKAGKKILINVDRLIDFLNTSIGC